MVWFLPRLLATLLALALGGSLGHVTSATLGHPETGAALGAAAALALAVVLDVLRAARLMRWLRGDMTSDAPPNTGFWGEVGYRVERSLRAREQALVQERLRLEELDGPEHLFLPPGGDRKYSVKELLDGVRRETAVDRPVRAAEAVKSATGLPSWPYVSLVCGAVAALLVLLVMVAPDNWRMYIAVPFAVFAAVTVLVVSRNPVHFYRRQLAYVVGAGLLLHAVGFSLQAAVKADPEKWGSINWDGSIHPFFYPVWCAIIVALINADLKTQAAARSHH